MEMDLFLILFYIAAMQVVMLTALIINYVRNKSAANSYQYAKPNPEKVKVMVHYENGERQLKEGSIIEGNMWQALEGKAAAYLRANGDKYKITPQSLQNNVFHVLDKSKIKIQETPPQPTQKEAPQEQIGKLSPEAITVLYNQWKDLSPEEVEKRRKDFLSFPVETQKSIIKLFAQEQKEVKHSDK